MQAISPSVRRNLVNGRTRLNGHALVPTGAVGLVTGKTHAMSACNTTIFVIDRDEAVRDALATSLEAAGHLVALFASARQFLDWYEPGQPGCLVVDLDLPGMGGAVLIAVLLARNVRLPAVVTSARLKNPKLIAGLPGGPIDILAKPFGDEELLERVRRALGPGEAAPAGDHSCGR